MRVKVVTLEDVLRDRSKRETKGTGADTYLAELLARGFDVVLVSYCEDKPDVPCLTVVCLDLRTKWKLETLLLGKVSLMNLDVTFRVPGQQVTPEFIARIENCG